MNERRTTDSTIDELLQGIENLSSREQAAVLRLAEQTEKIGRHTDFERPEVQAALGRAIAYKDRAIEYERAASGLFSDLAATGLQVDHISDLERDGVGDSRAVAPLLKWFGRTENPTLLDHIAVALGSAWAGDQGIKGLLAKFGRLSESNDRGPNSVRVTIVASLEKHARELGSPGTFLAIASDPANGFARSQAIRALANFPSQKDTVIPHLLEFLNASDSDLYFESARLLGRWKVTAARARLQDLIDTADQRHLADPHSTLDPEFERDELRKALWKIPPLAPE